MRIVLVMERLMAATRHLLRGHVGQLSSVVLQMNEWNGMEWNGMEWNGMEWNGMEWNGMNE